MNALLTPEQVAERLAVSPKMVRAWLREGKIPGIRLGRLWRVNPDALEAWIGGERTEPPQSAQTAPTPQEPKPEPKAPQKRAVRSTRALESTDADDAAYERRKRVAPPGVRVGRLWRVKDKRKRKR